MGTLKTQQFLIDTVNALIGAKGLRDLDRILTAELARYLRFDVAGLYLYNAAAHAFTPVSEALVDPASPGFQVGQLPAGGTLKEAVVQAGRAMVCNDIAASPWTEARAVAARGFTEASVVAAPLILPESAGGNGKTRTIGLLATIAVGRRGAFTEDDRLTLEALALRIAPALDSVLAAEERDALMAINSRVMVGSVTLEGLIPAIRDVLRQVVPHDVIGLVHFTMEADGPWFDPVYIDGFTLDLGPLRQHPFTRMAPAEVLATGRPVLITGYGHERFVDVPYFESLGIFSAMLCPLTVNGQPYGFLGIGSRRRNAFSERDLALAEQVGHHLSRAIANILAYDEIRRLKERLERENVYLKEEIGAAVDLKELVGASAAFQKTLKGIEQVARTETTVLITGETGTGKELVVQAIHQLSPRKDRPLIKVNCAALPPTLIESELFGHERGAFTGASARKVGRFELAEGGTIFLDEVGEIPLQLQTKLLRVLEAREMERVGSSRTMTLNVRVLAATNLDLEEAVRSGAFRADLYYRLKVFPVRLPPLRERREDIPLLARHFLRKYALRHRKPVTQIARTTLEALTAYPWPGNVRELEHVIERAVILSQGPSLTIEELSEPPAATARSGLSVAQARTLAEAERAHILEALARTNWIVAGSKGAAVRLGLKRSTLQHRMKKLGITRPA